MAMMYGRLLLCFCWLQVTCGRRMMKSQQVAHVGGVASQAIAFANRKSGFTVTQERVSHLCTDTVIKEACDTLGASHKGENPWASPAQLEETLAASAEDVDALLDAMFDEGELSGNKYFGVRALCEKAVSNIPTILGMAAPDSPWRACTDSACEDKTVDVSDKTLAESGLKTLAPDLGHKDTVLPPRLDAPPEPTDPEDHARDLFRRLLNVVYGIFPAVDEKEDDNPFLQLNEQGNNASTVNVSFTPGILPDRHEQYRAYMVKASAWIASALRRLKAGRKSAKKWFILATDEEIDEQIAIARKHLSMMLALTGRVVISSSDKSPCHYDGHSGTLAFVRAFNSEASRFREVGEKRNGRYLVHICEFYWHWGFGEATRVGTLVHEASHHFGTDDNGYCSSIDCTKLEPKKAQNNADSYTEYVKELVSTRRLHEEPLSSDLKPHKNCTTLCDPESVDGIIQKWTFKNMLPSKHCGECQEVTSLEMIRRGGRGKGCGEGRVEVDRNWRGGALCCTPLKCSLPDPPPRLPLGPGEAGWIQGNTGAKWAGLLLFLAGLLMAIQYASP